MTITRATVELIEKAIARTGSIHGACHELPDQPIRVITAVWNRMQDTVYPTNTPGRPGPKPRTEETP